MRCGRGEPRCRHLKWVQTLPPRPEESWLERGGGGGSGTARLAAPRFRQPPCAGWPDGSRAALAAAGRGGEASPLVELPSVAK